MQEFNFSRFDLTDSNKHRLIKQFINLLSEGISISEQSKNSLLDATNKFCPEIEASSTLSSPASSSSTTIEFFSSATDDEERGQKRAREEEKDTASSKLQRC